ncbi:MAG: riboflavin synthase subunit alpha [Undibacterium sp.]|nr:riboflavin synthase subunit alpha [Undibacterium sp.]
MFTGIVQAVASLQKIVDQTGLRTVQIAFPKGFCQDLAIGASVATDGVCLTVTRLPDENTAEFDIMQQTLNVTTLGQYAQGARVNVERAAKQGAEIGGHPLSGHIDFTAQLSQVRHLENNVVLRITVPKLWLGYIFSKGYIAINGASLTIAEVDREQAWFEVWLIPETLRMTVFAEKKVGDLLNIEIERNTQIVVDTVRSVLQENMADILKSMSTTTSTRL